MSSHQHDVMGQRAGKRCAQLAGTTWLGIHCDLLVLKTEVVRSRLAALEPEGPVKPKPLSTWPARWAS